MGCSEQAVLAAEALVRSTWPLPHHRALVFCTHSCVPCSCMFLLALTGSVSRSLQDAVQRASALRPPAGSAEKQQLRHFSLPMRVFAAREEGKSNGSPGLCCPKCQDQKQKRHF